jgi:hypothetical protein
MQISLQQRRGRFAATRLFFQEDRHRHSLGEVRFPAYIMLSLNPPSLCERGVLVVSIIFRSFGSGVTPVLGYAAE